MFTQNDGEKKLDWMYKGATSLVDREDYLLGRSVDKSLEQLNTQEKQKQLGTTAPPKNHVEHECIPPSIRDYKLQQALAEQVDLQAKLQEDPLLTIKKREEETRRQFLQNPVQLKKLQKALSKQEKKSKKKKNNLDEQLLEKLKFLQRGAADSDDEIVDMKARKEKDVDIILMHKFNALKSKLTETDLKNIMDGKFTDTEDSNSSELDNKIIKSEKTKKVKKTKRIKKNKRHESSSDSSSESNSSEVKNKKRRKKSKQKKDESSSDSSTESSSSSEEDSRKERKQKQSKRKQKLESESSNDEDEKDKKRKKKKKRRPKSENEADTENTKRSQRTQTDRNQRNTQKLPKSSLEDKSWNHSHPSRKHDQRDKPHKPSRHPTNEDEYINKYRNRSRTPNRKKTKNYSTRRSPARSRSRSKTPNRNNKRKMGPQRPPSTYTHSKYDSDDSDEGTRSKIQNWGLVKSDGTQIPLSRRSRSRETRKAEKITENPKVNSKPEQKRRKRLTSEDKERMLKEMMQNAAEHDKDRARNIKKYREDDAKEEKQRDFKEDFARKEFIKSANASTVESRIKANLNNIQRGRSDMNSHFSRRH